MRSRPDTNLMTFDYMFSPSFALDTPLRPCLSSSCVCFRRERWRHAVESTVLRKGIFTLQTTVCRKVAALYSPGGKKHVDATTTERRTDHWRPTIACQVDLVVPPSPRLLHTPPTTKIFRSTPQQHHEILSESGWKRISRCDVEKYVHVLGEY